MVTGVLGRLRHPGPSCEAGAWGNSLASPSSDQGSVVDMAPLRTRIPKFPGKAWPSQTFPKELSGQAVIRAAAPREQTSRGAYQEDEYVQQR